MSSHTGTYLLQILGHMQYIVALVFFYTVWLWNRYSFENWWQITPVIFNFSPWIFAFEMNLLILKKYIRGKKQFYCILLEMNFGVILLLGDCVYYDKQLCRLKSTSRLESHMIITKVIRSPVSLKSQFFQRPLHDYRYVVLFFLEVDVTWDFPNTNTSSSLLWSKGQEY